MPRQPGSPRRRREVFDRAGAHYRNHPASAWLRLVEREFVIKRRANPRKMYCYLRCNEAQAPRMASRAVRNSRAGRPPVWKSLQLCFMGPTWETASRFSAAIPRPSIGCSVRIDDALRGSSTWAARSCSASTTRIIFVMAHGVAGTLESLPFQRAHNEWRSAGREVDVWGFTFVASRKRRPALESSFRAVDLVSAVDRTESPSWHAEAGSRARLWMQPQVDQSVAREDGRIPDENDVRFCGKPGLLRRRARRELLYPPRWRPLLERAAVRCIRDPFAMDGSEDAPFRNGRQVSPNGRTRSRTSGNRIPSQREDVGWSSPPRIRAIQLRAAGAIQISMRQSIRGAYQAFFDSNIQADFVSIDDIAQYKIVYLAYPVMLEKGIRRQNFRAYVEQGGNSDQRRAPGIFRRSRTCRRSTAEFRSRQAVWRA